MIAAWHEDNVLERVIDNIIISQMYPRTMYHIFLGVYPNDAGTVKAARALEKNIINDTQRVECLSILNNQPYLLENSLKFYKILDLSKELSNFNWKKYSVIPYIKIMKCL